MQLGVVFPQTEIGSDPGAVRDYAQAAEALGYEHLLVFDHVLGADASKREEWNRPYSHVDTFHEPFVLFGYLAGVTEKLQMTTGILILPQRQAALVAKQAAAVDVLTGGRLRLGIGVGWNDVEYEALGESFRNRGRRCEEQIELMRACGPRTLSTSRVGTTRLLTPASTPCRCSSPFPSGSAAAPTRWWTASDGWATAGSPSSSPTAPARNASARCANSPPRPAGTPPASASRAVSITLMAPMPGTAPPRPGPNVAPPPVHQHHAGRLAQSRRSHQGH